MFGMVINTALLHNIHATLKIQISFKTKEKLQKNS